MDTNKLKKFAIEARNRLKAGVAAKMLTLGFDRNGNVPEHLHPQLMQGGSLWNGQLQTESFYNQWNALYKRIKQKGIKEVYEEAAYTWFNRLVAIRILQKNGIIEPVLEYVDAARTPRIVDEARMGRMPQMQEAQRIRLLELLDDDARIKDQFAVLIAAYCHQNPVINACFGSVDDYTELLLPNDILTEGGFVDMLNHTDFITDEDFHSPELIGWLYQFYISERKDEVFASFKNGKKAEAEDIPAATQIFTPNWIVKYMVQNTIGRIYLDNHHSAGSEFKAKWHYLMESSTPTPKEAIFQFNELTELLVGDLACGSGHILNECFDLLYDLYIYEGYSRREAVEYIFTYNLCGIDLDTRAKQMAQFALLLKACQKDLSFADAHIKPKVLNMPLPIPQEQLSDSMKEFFQETPSSLISKELNTAFKLMKNADSLGSIMEFNISETTRLSIVQAMDYWHSQSILSEQLKRMMASMELILSLTDKYSVLVMNPPYMGNGNMNSVLSDYVKCNYEKGKADLMTVFMQKAINSIIPNGYYSMINLPAWISLSTFGDLRNEIVSQSCIKSFLHLGRGIFGSDFGSVSFVIQNHKPTKQKGIYRRLFVEHVQVRSVKQIEELFLNKEFGMFEIDQSLLLKIPGSPIAYWLSDIMLEHFNSTSLMKQYAKPVEGIKTGDNDYFLKLWFEVSRKKEHLTKDDLSLDWYKITKGGAFRKWYGNLEYVCRWGKAGSVLKQNKKSCVSNEQLFFKPAVTWTYISSGAASFRHLEDDMLYNNKGPACYISSDKIDYFLALFNSIVTKEFLKILAPNIDFKPGNIANIPVKLNSNTSINSLSAINTQISKHDWDSHETSWDYEANSLVVLRNQFIADGCLDRSFKLSAFVNEFETRWEEHFIQLHHNEEELNRLFIEIYGLQDELTPDVPMDEITILQQGEISIVNNEIQWHRDVLMKQLISYAVGVWMGRYKLGKKGLHIAHPEPTDRELQEYWYGGERVFIDDDAIIPILPQNSPFDDNLSSRIADFIRIVFGADTLTENLNCIEKMLGTTIDQYVQKDFWKDHKKMYQNRPIYWLFSSKKGAFKCLTYMHRMDPYTAERVRSNYLLPYIEYLQNQIGDLESRAASLTTTENRKLTNLHKALDECQEYHERLQVVAEQAIGFDLDDGVIVNYAKFGDILAKIK